MDRVRQALRVLRDSRERLAGDEGQGLVEYCLILALVTLVVTIGGSLADIGVDASFRWTAAAF